MVAKKTSKEVLTKTLGAKKANAQNVPAPKKAAAHTKAKGPSPSPKFTADLTEVFQRHGWPGLPHELSFSAAAGECTRVCQDGSIAQPVWYSCPGGGQKRVCACPEDPDPSC